MLEQCLMEIGGAAKRGSKAWAVPFNKGQEDANYQTFTRAARPALAIAMRLHHLWNVIPGRG
jgi:hypothetical protein